MQNARSLWRISITSAVVAVCALLVVLATPLFPNGPAPPPPPSGSEAGVVINWPLFVSLVTCAVSTLSAVSTAVLAWRADFRASREERRKNAPLDRGPS